MMSRIITRKDLYDKQYDKAIEEITNDEDISKEKNIYKEAAVDFLESILEKSEKNSLENSTEGSKMNLGFGLEERGTKL